jgi:excisionase family DNA binding protein
MKSEATPLQPPSAALLTTEQLAQRLAVSARHVKSLQARRKIVPVRIGNTVRWHYETVLKHLQFGRHQKI